MDKQLLKFINKEVNAAEADTLITRETTSNGMEYITISLKINNEYKQLYSFWHNPKKKNREPPVVNDNNTVEEKKPKTTGGKKPYLMLMIKEIKALHDKGVKNVAELIGTVACLGENIEWNTGRLIKKRTKQALKYKDLQEILGYSNGKLSKILNELKEHDLLFKTEEGYFISSKYIKKGKMERKGQITVNKKL